jgi:Saccharopine dehydrogenase NADP binding domain
MAEQRIVIFGATGYTGRLIAERLVAQGARPVLAGRSLSRLEELAGSLGGLEVVRADVMRQNSVFDLVGADDVLVSTVGPFVKWGEPALRAAVAAGCTYLDSTGEPPFIRRVFEEFGPPAERSGARLLTAMGYDFAPGALAGALALEAAGPEATRVDVGYYALGGGPSSLSSGTRESLVGVTLDDGHAYRDGRVRTVRPAERVRSFMVAGKSREAISVGGAEHFGLPAAYGGLREVNVYLGWFGPLARPLQAGSFVGEFVRKVPLTTTAMKFAGERALGLVGGPEPGTTPGGRSWIAAEAYDAAGRKLSEVDLAGVDGYAFTAGFLAWAAQQRVEGAGALGPVQAYGLERLTAGASAAGLDRVP